MSDETVGEQEFWDQAQDPGRPNIYAIQLDRNPDEDPELGFSAEAYVDLSTHMAKFTAARNIAYRRLHGHAAKSMRVTLKIEFDPTDHPSEGQWPWFHAVDGQHRGGA